MPLPPLVYHDNSSNVTLQSWVRYLKDPQQPARIDGPIELWHFQGQMATGVLWLWPKSSEPANRKQQRRYITVLGSKTKLYENGLERESYYA